MTHKHKDKIDMLRRNLETNEKNFNEAKITKKQYRQRKRDARKAINRLKNDNE